jgi:hypothetical protein
VLLHEWPGVAPLGFNARGRLLTFDSGRRVFESHDLAATIAPAAGWNPTEDSAKVFGGALSADRKVLATVAEVGKKQSRIELWNAETGERPGPACGSRGECLFHPLAPPARREGGQPGTSSPAYTPRSGQSPGDDQTAEVRR